MDGSSRFGERLTALFVLGVVAFNPTIVAIFDAGAETTVFTIPVLYAYVFVAWGVLIGLLALVVERSGRGVERRRETGGDGGNV